MSKCPLPSVKVSVIQQETVRLLTLEFMGVEGPPAPFWALLLFALCWLAPRYIAADLGVSILGVKAMYGLPVPVFFDLETWRPNPSGSWRHSDAGLWKLMARYEPRMQPGLFATTLKKLLEVCQQLLAQMSTQEKALLKGGALRLA